jgi:hypothetical protein
MAVLPLGPIPALNGVASTQMSTQIGAGNAAGLFPVITPSPSASPTPQRAATQPSKHHAATLPDASQVSLSSTSSLTAEAAGLIVLGLAIMLTVTRLSARRRTGKPRD